MRSAAKTKVESETFMLARLMVLVSGTSIEKDAPSHLGGGTMCQCLLCAFYSSHTVQDLYYAGTSKSR